MVDNGTAAAVIVYDLQGRVLYRTVTGKPLIDLSKTVLFRIVNIRSVQAKQQ